MKIIEIEGKQYNLPTGWEEVSISMFEEIYKLTALIDEYKSDTQFALDMFAAITGAPMSDLSKLTRAGFDVMVKLTEWANEPIKPTNKKTFVVGGSEFIAIEDMSTLTMGDTISIELMVKESKEWELLPNMLPILLRRVKEVEKGGKIKKMPADFDPNEYAELRELFRKELMVADVFRLKVFFSNTEKPSSTTIKDTLVKLK